MSAPTTTSVLRLATRPSPMALEQTDRFAGLFRHRHPDITLEIIHVVSEGDAHRGPLAQIGGKGAFTRRADTLLLDGRVDATIACAKDVPSEHDRAPGISLGAVLPREDARDALVLPTGHPPTRLTDLPPGTRVGTSAPRRAALLRALHPRLVPVAIRGNADRRLTRLDAGTLGADVMIAAYAGLRRLGHTDRASEILDPARWLPASGAGIVTIEHRTGDTATHSRLTTLTHTPTELQYTAERATLAALMGGCLTAASAHAVLDPDGRQLTVHAAVLDPAGNAPLTASASGPCTEAGNTGHRTGQQLLAAGAARLLAAGHDTRNRIS
ncbi:hydroxymethylbilane synthase [Streptomyces sp. NPDC087849]|uniref:hydroxymethylbilane synthase n=1 Tax=Streptomyces sp. NPDC087849 TaxID=3365808 RepID=UPI003815FA7A